MGGVLAFDLAAGLCGYCAGDGSRAPTADAWRFPKLGGDLGALAVAWEDQANALIDLHAPGFVAYEAPLLLSHDALEDLRRIYGLGWEIERLCVRRGLPCGEVSTKRVKNFVTGDQWAKKPVVAAKIESLGIALPRTPAEGRFDAGDAAGVWLVTMAEHYPDEASPWLAKLRGHLL